MNQWTTRNSFDPNGPLSLILLILALVLVGEAMVIIRETLRLRRAAVAGMIKG